MGFFSFMELIEINIDHLSSTVRGGPMNMRDKQWIEAFRLYNKFNTHEQLGMGCRPCYANVLSFLKGYRIGYEQARTTP